MKISIVVGGPGRLYFALLAKKQFVAADGINSGLRSAHAEHFGTTIDQCANV